MKTFTIGPILSAYTGVLLCPIDQLYEILNYLCDDNLYTHQLPRAIDECRAALPKQLPWLVDVDASGVNRENWSEWLNEQRVKYGWLFELQPLGVAEHTYKDPVDELVDMAGEDRVIISYPLDELEGE
jgi:hypothetical protein